MKARHLLLAALFWIIVFECAGCGLSPPAGEQVGAGGAIGQTEQSDQASCLFGQNPWTASYPTRTTCVWQPGSGITPVPTGTEFCSGPPPANRCDVFSGINGTGQCARLIVPAGAPGWTYGYNAVLGNGWLTQSPGLWPTWVQSVYCGSHVKDFCASKTPCVTCGFCGGNGGVAFSVPDVTGQFGADMQLATIRVRQVAP